MARHLRVEYPGAIYHVACRMIGDSRLEQSRLFIDDKDRERFLKAIGSNRGHIPTTDKWACKEKGDVVGVVVCQGR